MTDSRYTYVGSSPQMAPAQCLLSGQTADLVDTGRTILGYGRVYLSADTIAELARVSGYSPPVEVLVEQATWYNNGVADTIKKDYDDRLRTLTAEFIAAAERLERAVDGASGEVPPADAGELESPAGELEGDGGDTGGDAGAVDLEKPRDERTPDATRGGKGRGRVQRPSLDDTFAI